MIEEMNEDHATPEGPEGPEEDNRDTRAGEDAGTYIPSRDKISKVRGNLNNNNKTQDMNQIADDFANMTTDERLWYVFRRQLRVYRAINNLLGLDPDNAEIPWATQVELAGLIRDAREIKDRVARAREQRATTLTNVLRYVLGGMGLAMALKIIDLILTVTPAVHIGK
jgi:hypothetical protein